jgi:hypothetical protein
MSHSSARFEKLVREALEQASDLPPTAQARIREDLRLQADYPGQYVAYVDSWKARHKGRQLHREVVAHAQTLPDLHRRLSQLPAEIQAKASIDYVLDPEGPIEVHYDLPDR